MLSGNGHYNKHCTDPEKTTLESSKLATNASAMCPNVDDIKEFDLVERARGQGCFEQVYKGKRTETIVTLKTVTIDRLSISMAFVFNKVELVSKLRHPNIVLLLA